MNRLMQKEIIKELTPFMIPDWKVKLNRAVDQDTLIIKR